MWESGRGLGFGGSMDLVLVSVQRAKNAGESCNEKITTRKSLKGVPCNTLVCVPRSPSYARPSGGAGESPGQSRNLPTRPSGSGSLQ